VLMLKGSLTFSLHGETVGYTIDCVPWCSSQVCQQANCNCRRILGWPEFLILVGQVTWLGLGSEHVATQLGEIALPGPDSVKQTHFICHNIIIYKII